MRAPLGEQARGFFRGPLDAQLAQSDSDQFPDRLQLEPRHRGHREARQGGEPGGGHRGNNGVGLGDEIEERFRLLLLCLLAATACFLFSFFRSPTSQFDRVERVTFKKGRKKTLRGGNKIAPSLEVGREQSPITGAGGGQMFGFTF